MRPCASRSGFDLRTVTVAIRARGIGKRYPLAHRPRGGETLRDALARRLSRRRAPQAPGRPDHLWALRDVSFDVARGDVVGIIGPNGAGKSTLLRILSRITEPTEGYAQTSGRVGSLLEIGTGFHNELSGRENVYLSGAVLGMKKATIDRKFDEIVEFSGVEPFLDTALKHYSSGMQLRLAFAISAHLEPEIVLVDEVLAVGDVAFQQKCMGKMGDVAAGGRTVLLVSHNMAAVRSLCRRGMVIDHGQLTFAGDIDDCIESYYRSLGVFGDGDEPADDGDGLPRLRFGAISLAGRHGNTVRQDEPVTVTTTLTVPELAAGLKVSCQVADVHGRRILLSTRDSLSLGLARLEPAVYRVTAECPALWLNPGLYSLSFDAHLWTTGRKARCRSGSFPLDIEGESGPSDAVLHPSIQWSLAGASGAPLPA